MVRLYFELPEYFLEDTLKANPPYVLTDDEELDIDKIKIYECSSKKGTYILVEEVDYNPHNEYVETSSEGDPLNWFKLSYVDSGSLESDQSDPILGANIYDIIDRIALSLGDTQRGDPLTMAFLDEEYVTKIRGACKRYRGREDITELKDYEFELVILLVRQSACYDLAYDNARFTKITLPDGISIDKGQRVNHYLKIASQLEKQYLSSVNEMRRDDYVGQNEQVMEVINTTRRKYFNRSHFKSPR